MNKKQYRILSRAVRAMIGRVGSSYSIRVVPGDAPPQLVGESFHWTTPGGKPIRHPNAYRWPKVYHASTLHVVVGRMCLEELRLPCPDVDGFVRAG